MNMLGGLIGGALGGLIGAAVWAGIAYTTGYEIGWIAWGVGVLVGFGVTRGGKGRGVPAGVLAVGITILSILAGKYAVIDLVLRKELGNQSEATASALASLDNEEHLISWVADDLIEALEARGETVDWPAGVEPTEAEKEADYPPPIWTQAKTKWDGWNEQERQAYRDQVAENIRQNVAAFFQHGSTALLLGSFGLMDLVFFGLAVVTAFKIAAREPGLKPASATGPEPGGEPPA